jgi:hypothetical protein
MIVRVRWTARLKRAGELWSLLAYPGYHLNGQNKTQMPFLDALNWSLNWLFGIGDPKSSVWLYSVLDCRIENQFRAPPLVRPTYRLVDSEAWTSVLRLNWPRSRSLFWKQKTQKYELYSFVPFALEEASRRRRQVRSAASPHPLPVSYLRHMPSLFPVLPFPLAAPSTRNPSK